MSYQEPDQEILSEIDPDAPANSPFVPILLPMLAVLILLFFQAIQLDKDHNALSSARADQEPNIETALAVRHQLEGIAVDTQRLADAGNENAQILVNQLAERGITIDTGDAQMSDTDLELDEEPETDLDTELGGGAGPAAE